MSCNGIEKTGVQPVADEIEESIVEGGSIATIAADAKTTILTYTNTSGILYLDGYAGTGSVDAEYILVIDTVEKIFLRSSEQERNVQMPFPRPIKIAQGSIIDIKVTHWTSGTADFDATLFGHRR